MHYDIEGYEAIDLTPDMSKMWGTVLRGLREKRENFLYAACSELKDIEYTNDTIEIYCKDDMTFELLKKNIKKIESIAGKGIINIYKKKVHTKHNQQIIDGLKGLFGDRLTVR